MFVVKSLDGVEKRFKDANSPEAIEWKNKTTKKVRAPAAKKKTFLDPSVLIGRACNSQSLSWGEIDSSDVLMTQIAPFLARNVTEEYPEDFIRAVSSARRGDGWSLLPFLDQYARRFEKMKDWSEYTDNIEREYKQLMNDNE